MRRGFGPQNVNAWRLYDPDNPADSKAFYFSREAADAVPPGEERRFAVEQVTLFGAAPGRFLIVFNERQRRLAPSTSAGETYP